MADVSRETFCMQFLPIIIVIKGVSIIFLKKCKISCKNLLSHVSRETCMWYNDSASAESKSANAALPLLRIGLYLATHGLKIKCPFGPLDFLRTWYNVHVSNEQCGIR